MHGRAHQHLDCFQIQVARLAQPVKMVRSSCSTSRATSCWMASAVFFLRRQRFLNRPQAADLLIDLDEFSAAESLKLAKLGDFPLRFAHCSWCRQGFRHRLAVPFVGSAGSVRDRDPRAVRNGSSVFRSGIRLQPRSQDAYPSDLPERASNSARRDSNSGRDSATGPSFLEVVYTSRIAATTALLRLPPFLGRAPSLDLALAPVEGFGVFIGPCHKALDR